MRELVFEITEPFSQGLRPEDNFLNREGFLEECLNLIPTPGGLERFEDPTDPFSGGQTIEFPFPQVFHGRDLTVMLTSNSLSEIDTSAIPWTKTAIQTKDPSAPASNKTIPKDGIWHFIDLGPSFYAFNGSATVFRTGLDLLSGGTTTTYVNTSVTIKTGCEHKGRVFIGGFDKSNIWNNTWGTIFAEWEAEAGLQELDLMKDGPGANWVMWSTIGGGDIPLWLLFPSGYADLQLGPTRELVIQRIKRNELGWAPLKMPGNVEVLKPLGDAVIAYGDEGIEALIPQGNQIGFRRVARFGIMGRGSVTGDDRSHIFLDKEGNVWTLGADFSLSKIGYKEWFGSFAATSTAMSYEPIDQEVYISDPDEAYVLTSNGLAEHDTKVTSLVQKNGVAYGIGVAATSTDIRVMTGAHNNRREALKTIHNIQVHYSDIDNLKVTVLYRNDHTSAFKTFPARSVNPQGVVTLMLTSREFKIRITGTPGDKPRLDGLEIRWNLVDKRAVRGPFA